MGVYREQHWKCQACGATGLIFVHITDSKAKQRERLEQSHRAQKSKAACPRPRLVAMLSQETV